MPPPEPGEFRFIGERDRFRSSFIRLVTGTLVDPNGFTFERDIVRHPGAVCIVPLEADGRHVLMVRQYRAPIDRFVLEVPAGKRDVFGEPPQETARRELAEEVGREAASWNELGRFCNSPGFTDEETVCYLAEDLTEVPSSAHGIEEDHMTIERIALSELWDLTSLGVLIDAKTIIALALAERALLARRGSLF